MEKRIDIEEIGYCLDAITGNLEFIGRRLEDLRSGLPANQEFPPETAELAEKVIRLYRWVENLVQRLPFPRV